MLKLINRRPNSVFGSQIDHAELFNCLGFWCGMRWRGSSHRFSCVTTECLSKVPAHPCSSVWNKLKELEICAQLQNCSVTGATGTWQWLLHCGWVQAVQEEPARWQAEVAFVWESSGALLWDWRGSSIASRAIWELSYLYVCYKPLDEAEEVLFR